MENNFKKICCLSELKEKEGKQFFIDDIEIAIFKVDNKVYALSNICPHQKVHLIHEGFIEDGKVSCLIHGWQFELETGNISKERKGLNKYEVKIIDNEVYVKVKQKEFNW